MNKPNSHVYFASCHTFDGADMGIVKIGNSSNPERRVALIGTKEPFRCKLICSTPGDLFLEQFCHIWLRQDHVVAEYFRPSNELMRLVKSVQDTGKLPFPIKNVSQEGMFMNLDLVGYMDRNAITLADVQKHTGLSSAHYEKVLSESRCGSRRLLAAVAVTAVRKGLTIHWARDFKPGTVERAAA